MSDSEWITNASQIETVSARDLPSKPHELTGLKTRNGKTPKLKVCAITVGDYGDYEEACRVYNDAGAYVGENLKDNDLKLLWWCCRDAHDNYQWKDVEACVAQVRTWPLQVKRELLAAVNEINALQKPEVVEGNSGGDQDGSPSSDSAPTSESGTPTS